jgi:hypothetical protein
VLRSVAGCRTSNLQLSGLKEIFVAADSRRRGSTDEKNELCTTEKQSDKKSGPGGKKISPMAKSS